MFAGQIYAPRRVKLVDVEELPWKERAEDAAGEILFRPELACLCGSDLLYYEADYPEYQPKTGQSLHEMIGRVVRTNGQRFQPGQRVLCVPIDHFGFYAQFPVSERRAIAIDPRVSDEHAVLAQPLGTVIYGLRKLPSLLDKDVVVVGQGPIGQLFCAVASNLGARQIIALDLLDSRLETSPRMGATSMINVERDDAVQAVKELTGGVMADVVVEAVGHREQRLNDCFQLVRKGGDILFFGVPTLKLDDVHWRILFDKNASVHTSIGPSFERDFPLAMRWIAEKRLDVGPLITHRFPLAEIQQAFDTFAERRDGALKVFVEFPG